VTGPRADEQVLVRHEDAPWLPAGGRADVVLAGPGSPVPAPACLVRVLATRDDRILARQRPDGRGLDIPTRPVDDGAVDDRLRGLVAEAVGGLVPTTLLGWVRNVVPEPGDAYPWPTPEACFVVWHCAVPGGHDPDGVWLDAAEAPAVLGDRHWWPLAAHVPHLTP
jgi:hypothetical protein